LRYIEDKKAEKDNSRAGIPALKGQFSSDSKPAGKKPKEGSQKAPFDLGRRITGKKRRKEEASHLGKAEVNGSVRVESEKNEKKKELSRVAEEPKPWLSTCGLPWKRKRSNRSGGNVITEEQRLRHKSGRVGGNEVPWKKNLGTTDC